jgi:Tfp pilus assembly protein FimV
VRCQPQRQRSAQEEYFLSPHGALRKAKRSRTLDTPHELVHILREMFGKPSSLELRVEQLEDSIEQLRAQWKEWRRQLANAAARLERAEARAIAREEKSPGAKLQPPAAVSEPVDRIAQLNAEILRARGEGRAPQIPSDGAGTPVGFGGAALGS